MSPTLFPDSHIFNQIDFAQIFDFLPANLDRLNSTLYTDYILEVLTQIRVGMLKNREIENKVHFSVHAVAVYIHAHHSSRVSI